MVTFPGLKNFTVDSISLNAMKILRWIWATLRLDAPLHVVTSIVILLLILTTIVVIAIVLCAFDGTSWLVLLLTLSFCVFVCVTMSEYNFFLSSFVLGWAVTFFNNSRSLSRWCSWWSREFLCKLLKLDSRRGYFG